MEKLKNNFIVINLKKYIVSIISVIFIITLVLYSNTKYLYSVGNAFWAVKSLMPQPVDSEPKKDNVNF